MSLPETDQQDEERDVLEGVQSLPYVQTVETTMVSMQPKRESPRKKPQKKANIQKRLRLFSPKSKKAMVTMSDMSMSGGAHGGAKPARNKDK